ncbi:Hypothetical predicted protein, partial [Marmota monax]
IYPFTYLFFKSPRFPGEGRQVPAKFSTYGFKMNKVCAIFGGSRGIGRAVAQLMAQKGYRLAIIARNLEVAKAAAGDLGGRYRACSAA